MEEGHQLLAGQKGVSALVLTDGGQGGQFLLTRNG